MSETAIINPNEQYIQPTEQLAALEVFSGVYNSFADEAKQSAKRRVELVDSQGVTVEVNPPLDFVQERFKAAQEKVEPLAGLAVRPSEVQDKFMEEAKVEAHKAYDGRPSGEAVRLERANRVVSSFIDRAGDMFTQGETDGLTIKLFFDRLEGFKYGLSLGYNGLVTKKDEPMPGKEAQADYHRAIQSTYGDKANVKEQENGSFLHVNGNRHLASGSPTTERIYISPKLNEQPGEVVKVWADTLQELGLDEKVYYKVAEGMSRRYDTVITYVTPETASDAERAVQEFVKRCPPELLSDTTMPSGIEVAKGVSRAPEPDELNTLLRYRGKDTISYNEFACAITELALRRASYDFMIRGDPAEQVTPKALSEAAQPFFVQFVKLSGLDPITMKAA